MQAFLFIITLIFCFQSLAQDYSWGNEYRDSFVLESNDAGEVIYLEEEHTTFLENQGYVYLELLVSFFNFKKSFEEVGAYLTPTLEEAFDLFILVNVDHENRYNSGHEIPAQHMKIIQRTKSGEKLFKRRGGKVVGISNKVTGNNGQPALPDSVVATNGKSVNGVGFFLTLGQFQVVPGTLKEIRNLM